MEQRFGATNAFVRRHNPKLKSLDTLRPQSATAPYALLGTAVDYRIRYYFEDAVRQWLAAHVGAMLLCPGQPLDLGNTTVKGLDLGPVRYPTLDAPSVSDFFCSLTAFVERLPRGQRLDRNNEETLCRYCVVLAYFEEAGRVGPRFLVDSPLLRVRRPTVDDLLSLPEDAWVEDLAAQSRLFYERAGDRISQPHWLNPIFEGTDDVGGADADLILGSVLIDIKATVNPKITRAWLWQLLGYALLDYSDRYGINAVGVYLSRQGHFLEWPIDTLAGQIASQADSWDAVRRDFRQMASRMV